jgi:hypothetical protein
VKVFLFFCLFGLGALLTGCGRRLSSDEALAVAGRTAMVRELAGSHTNLFMMVEGEQKKFVQIFLGFDMGTHSSRYATLFVYTGRHIWAEMLGEKGDLQRKRVR